jgi:hypothetical protein
VVTSDALGVAKDEDGGQAARSLRVGHLVALAISLRGPPYFAGVTRPRARERTGLTDVGVASFHAANIWHGHRRFLRRRRRRVNRVLEGIRSDRLPVDP